MTQEMILNLLKKAKDDALSLGFEKIGLFGSYATSCEHVTSDIDIAVYSNKEKTGFGFDYLEKLEQLQHKLQKIFKRPVDVYDLNRSNETPIKNRIEKEVIHV